MRKRSNSRRIMASAKRSKCLATRPSQYTPLPPRPSALRNWTTEIMASDGLGSNVITIFDVIGEDPWSGGGVTLANIDTALRSIGKQDVEVQINSPGGDLFEGIAIYNRFLDHPGNVTVKVMGLAGSAASIIAMAGNEILMGEGSMLFIHCCWCFAIINQHSQQVIDDLAKFDGEMRDIYMGKSKASSDQIEKWMAAETFLSAEEAIAAGLATGELPMVKNSIETRPRALADMATRRIHSHLVHYAGHLPEEAEGLISDAESVREVEKALTKDGPERFTRTEARQLIAEAKVNGSFQNTRSKPGAAPAPQRDAVDPSVLRSLAALRDATKKKS